MVTKILTSPVGPSNTSRIEAALTVGSFRQTLKSSSRSEGGIVSDGRHLMRTFSVNTIFPVVVSTGATMLTSSGRRKMREKNPIDNQLSLAAYRFHFSFVGPATRTFSRHAILRPARRT